MLRVQRIQGLVPFGGRKAAVVKTLVLVNGAGMGIMGFRHVSARHDSQEGRQGPPLFQEKLKLTLPPQPPPKITAAQATSATPV